MEMKKQANGAWLFILGGALLVIEYALLWFVEKPVVNAVLDYIAVALWFTGVIFIFVPIFDLRCKSNVPRGKGYTETKKLVNTGFYAAVRHPQYLGWVLMYAALVFFNPNWIIIITGFTGMVCVYEISRREDVRLVEKFGGIYETYMDNVPAMNLPLGLVRAAKKKGKKDK